MQFWKDMEILGSYITTQKTKYMNSDYSDHNLLNFKFVRARFHSNQRQCCDVSSGNAQIKLFRLLFKPRKSLQKWVAPIVQIWHKMLQINHLCLV